MSLGIPWFADNVMMLTILITRSSRDDPSLVFLGLAAVCGCTNGFSGTQPYVYVGSGHSKISAQDLI